MEEKLEKKDTSKPKTNNTHAYHLRNSDNSRTPFIKTLMNGENYSTWARSIKTTLHAKMKINFIYGTINRPSTQSKEHHNREKDDLMGMVWMINLT